MRYKIELSYVGTNFHGWQKQPNAISVQQTIEEAILILFKQTIELTGCGRTDTGVHAKFFVAHFDADIEFDNNHIFRLNCYLPKSISIISIEKTENNFHARFNAKSRSYQYIITTKKSPFLVGFSWYIPFNLDVGIMNEASSLLLNYTDFSSFSKLHTDVKNNNCKIIEAEFQENHNLLIFRITANRFLRNMVRAIIGTIVEIGRKKINIEDLKNIIESKNRCLAGQSAPADGLYLTNVQY